MRYGPPVRFVIVLGQGVGTMIAQARHGSCSVCSNESNELSRGVHLTMLVARSLRAAPHHLPPRQRQLDHSVPGELRHIERAPAAFEGCPAGTGERGPHPSVLSGGVHVDAAVVVGVRDEQTAGGEGGDV